MPKVPPPSPPKRVTRARAKAIEESKPSKLKTTRITTPAAKVAGTGLTKRKTRADEDAPADTAAPVEAPKATRGRPRKTVVLKEETEAQVPAPAEKATRGRKKKVTETEDAEQSEAIEPAPPVAKVTRTTRAAAPTTTAAPLKSALKKKVTFQDILPEEKENAVTLPTSRKRAASKSEQLATKTTGLAAKPIRRPAAKAATTTAKRTKTARGAQQDASKPVPLSPKKDRQVAKVTPPPDADDTEDELSGEKTPMKPLSMSPVKMASVRKSPSKAAFEPSMSIDELQMPELPPSPTRTIMLPAMASPARRPPPGPPSPFKDSLKQSPMKVSMPHPSAFQQSLAAPSSTPFKSSFMKSPMKFNLNSQSRPVFQAPNSSFKASLLQSPAIRRPATSPFKTIAPGSPGKSRLAEPVTDRLHAMTPLKTTIIEERSPVRNLHDAFEAAKEPERTVLGDITPTDEEAPSLEQQLNDEEMTIDVEVEVNVRISSPLSEAPATPASVKPTRRRSLIPVPSPARSEPAMEVEQVEDDTDEMEDVQPSPPAQSPVEQHTPVIHFEPRFNVQTPATVYPSDDESEDELQMTGQNFAGLATPTPFPPKTPGTSGNVEMMTLAEQFGNWAGATPDPRLVSQREAERRGIFSPVKRAFKEAEDKRLSLQGVPSPHFFDDQMAVTEAAEEGNDTEMTDYEFVNEENYFRTSQMSDASQEYGDENETPVDPALLAMIATSPAPSVSVTPVRVFNQARVIHTVSKVPLKPAAEDSPLRKPIYRRAKSMSGPLSPRSDFTMQDIHRTQQPSHPTQPSTPSKAEAPAQEYTTPTRPSPAVPATPNVLPPSLSSMTPVRTPRPGLNTALLTGAVVYVDVHTSEGADASSIFVELLSQMGAKCVKTWSWNPRASVSGNGDSSDEDGKRQTKVGITHVVFKDGGVRTMEKCRQAGSVVACVGVGWVLDCERENKWLDESAYLLDTTATPRGGARRRKSMEPRALSNVNGSLVFAPSPLKNSTTLPPSPVRNPSRAPSPAAPVAGDVEVDENGNEHITQSPETDTFRIFSSPPNRRQSFAVDPREVRRVSFYPVAEEIPTPSHDTPGSYHPSPAGTEGMSDWSSPDPLHDDAFNPETPIRDITGRPLPSALDTPLPAHDPTTPSLNYGGSPTTPYFLKPESLVQKTCPPKAQQGERLFPVSGRIQDAEEGLRMRLLKARRKSLQFAPRVGSPLRRGG